VWKSYTIPAPGEPGNDTWPGDSWRTGGAPVWVTGSFDPKLGLTYWGTGNPGPWTGDTRPGDNLYTNSVVAFDVETGALRGYHQYHWNDSWDWDEVDPPILVDLQLGGRTVKSLVHPGRNGYLWTLERSAEAIKFVSARPFVHQDVFTKVDARTGRPEYDPAKTPGINKTVTFCPSLWGGKDWPSASYSASSGLLYIPANDNICGTLVGEDKPRVEGQLWLGADVDKLDLSLPRGSAYIGELQAWDIVGGKKVWSAKFPHQLFASVLSTGGGLVFVGGTNDRFFRAFDAKTGELLWQQRTSSGIMGNPVAFEVDGVQYIAVQSGWGVDGQRIQDALAKLNVGAVPDVPQGGVVWVFALKQ
jgi:alcohol dehydrogenase (cytochrome c)